MTILYGLLVLLVTMLAITITSLYDLTILLFISFVYHCQYSTDTESVLDAKDGR